MFTHIVFYRVENPEENLPKMKELLCSLPAKIDVIRSLKFGIDELKTPRSVDGCLYVEFNSEADYHYYKDHPEHLKVAEFIGKIKKEAYSADFNE